MLRLCEFAHKDARFISSTIERHAFLPEGCRPSAETAIPTTISPFPSFCFLNWRNFSSKSRIACEVASILIVSVNAGNSISSTAPAFLTANFSSFLRGCRILHPCRKALLSIITTVRNPQSAFTASTNRHHCIKCVLMLSSIRSLVR